MVQKGIDGLEFEVLEKDRVVCMVYYEGRRFIDFYGSKLDRCFCPLSASDKDIEEFFVERTVPETRVNIKQILKSSGLSEFDALELCKRYKGMLNEDVYWIRFPWDKGKSYAEALEEVKKL